MEKINYKLINFFLITVIFFLITKTFNVWYNLFIIIKKILMPIIISFAISYSLFPIVKALRIKIRNNKISVAIIIIIIFIIIFLLLYLSIPLLIKQITSLSKDIIPFINNLSTKIDFIDMSLIEEMLITSIENFIIKFGTNGSPTLIFSSSLEFIKNFVLVLVLSIYFLFNMDSIKEKIVFFIKNGKYYILIKNIHNSLNNYLKGLFLIIFIEIIEYTFVYFIVGHPNFLLLGILAGITTIIPYFGNLFTNVLALITAISVSNKLFIICSIIAIFLPIIDSYIVDPKIYNKTTNISPIKIIVSIIISSILFGVFGFIIAVPLYLIVEEIFLFLQYKNNFKN